MSLSPDGIPAASTPGCCPLCGYNLPCPTHPGIGQKKSPHRKVDLIGQEVALVEKDAYGTCITMRGVLVSVGVAFSSVGYPLRGIPPDYLMRLSALKESKRWVCLAVRAGERDRKNPDTLLPYFVPLQEIRAITDDLLRQDKLHDAKQASASRLRKRTLAQLEIRQCAIMTVLSQVGLNRRYALCDDDDEHIACVLVAGGVVPPVVVPTEEWDVLVNIRTLFYGILEGKE